MPAIRRGLVVLAVLASGCWPGPLVRVDGGGTTTDGLPVIPTFQALAPCLTPADYSGGTTVSFGNQLGDSYSPKCLSIHAGSDVLFSGDFNSHPLRASTRGSSSNPIQSTQSGSTASFHFGVAGYFPYYCTQHGDNSGGGMAGVVEVVAP